MGANFMKETFFKSPEKLDWFALSLKPVQKLPQLKTLLERLFKKTPKGHPERPELKRCLKTVTSFLQSLNETKREQEREEERKEMERHRMEFQEGCTGCRTGSKCRQT